MTITTKHGEYDCKKMNRKQRREMYKKVKKVFASGDLEQLHDLGDDFALFAFGDDKKVEEQLGKLTALEEDEVLTSIISSYMGLDLGNLTGD
tara:strand:+ start:5838 stop:6113 length:276 start_codon:yes stop_codon:yes gene_type:complete